ncbi:MAG: hypothetical protein LBJ09_01550 [Clostridiales bacterium]|nr:hypothetical protein [Clostridiales bacterium]
MIKIRKCFKRSFSFVMFVFILFLVNALYNFTQVSANPEAYARFEEKELIVLSPDHDVEILVNNVKKIVSKSNKIIKIEYFNLTKGIETREIDNFYEVKVIINTPNEIKILASVFLFNDGKNWEVIPVLFEKY